MLNNNKLTLLHSIRGFAAFYVVIAHSKFPLWSGGNAYLSKYPTESWNLLDYLLFAIDMLSSNGTSMVIIFFVLSGFFIAYSFDKNTWKLKKFYANRAIRIYVPYVFSMLFAAGVLLLLGRFVPSVYQLPIKTEFLISLNQSYELLNAKSFLAGLAFMKYQEQYFGFNFPYWSLLYEGIFYLCAPWVVKKPKLYLGVSAILLLVSAFIPIQSNPFLKFGLEFSFYFALGINLFNYCKTARRSEWLKPAYITASLIVFFFVFVLTGVAGFHRFSFVLAGIFACLVIYFFLFYNISENIGIRFFKKMGMISFTLYLFHFPILILTFGLLHYFTGESIFYNRIYWFGVIIATCLSFPIYYLVEEKSLRIISRLKKKSVEQPSPALK